MDDNDRLLMAEAALRRSQERIEDLLKISAGSSAPTLVVWREETIAALEAIQTVRASFKDSTR